MQQIITLVDSHTQAQRTDDANKIRDYADRVERGEISELVIVCNDRENNWYERFGVFADRWRMLGAIEYAKSAILDLE